MLALSVAVSVWIMGCSKPNSPGADGEAVDSSASAGGPGVTAVGPDVGAVTPVTGTSLDDASGGGVNSAAMKKAKGIAAQGVGSVNNAERQGYGAGD
jgi:hypothetical protein